MLGEDQGQALVVIGAESMRLFMSALVILQVVKGGDREGDLAENYRAIVFIIHWILSFRVELQCL